MNATTKLQELINILTGKVHAIPVSSSVVDDSETNYREYRKHYSSYAYERLFDELNIRSCPLFTNVQSVASLNTYNGWLPHRNLNDRRISDTISTMLRYRCLSNSDGGLVEPCGTCGHERRRSNCGGGGGGGGTGTNICNGQHLDGDGVDCCSNNAIDVVVKTPEVCFIDINAHSVMQENETKRTLIDYGIIDPTDTLPMYKRHYMNAQFSTKGNMQATISEPLERMWGRFCEVVFSMTDDAYYNLNGQKLPASLSRDTVRTFVVPFVNQYAGRRSYAYQLLSDVMENDAMKRNNISLSGSTTINNLMDKLSNTQPEEKHDDGNRDPTTGLIERFFFRCMTQQQE